MKKQLEDRNRESIQLPTYLQSSSYKVNSIPGEHIKIFKNAASERYRIKSTLLNEDEQMKEEKAKPHTSSSNTRSSKYGPFCKYFDESHVWIKRKETPCMTGYKIVTDFSHRQPMSLASQFKFFKKSPSNFPKFSEEEIVPREVPNSKLYSFQRPKTSYNTSDVNMFSNKENKYMNEFNNCIQRDIIKSKILTNGVNYIEISKEKNSIVENINCALDLEFSINNFQIAIELLEKSKRTFLEIDKWIPTKEFLEDNDDCPTYQELYQHLIKLGSLNEQKDKEIEIIKESAIQGIIEKEELLQDLQNELQNSRKISWKKKMAEPETLGVELNYNENLRTRILTMADDWDNEREEYERKINFLIKSQDETIFERVQNEIQTQKSIEMKLLNDLRLSEEYKLEAEKERSKAFDKFHYCMKELQEANLKIEKLSNAQNELIELHSFEKGSYNSTIQCLRSSLEENIHLHKLEKNNLNRGLEEANELIQKLETELNENKGRECKILERLEYSEDSMRRGKIQSDDCIFRLKEKLERQEKEFNAERTELERQISELSEDLLDVKTTTYNRKSTFNRFYKQNSVVNYEDNSLKEAKENCIRLKTKYKLLKKKYSDLEKLFKKSEQNSSTIPIQIGNITNNSTDEHDENSSNNSDVINYESHLDILIKSVLNNMKIQNENPLNSISIALNNNKEALKSINFENDIKDVILKIFKSLKVSFYEESLSLTNAINEFRRVNMQLQRNQILTNNCVTLLMTRGKQLKARNIFLKVSIKGSKKTIAKFKKDIEDMKSKNTELKSTIEILQTNVEELKNNQNIEKTIASPTFPNNSLHETNIHIDELRKELREAQESIKKSSQSSRKRLLEIASLKEKLTALNKEKEDLLIIHREMIISTLDKEKHLVEFQKENECLKADNASMKLEIQSNIESGNKDNAAMLNTKLLKKKMKITGLREQINSLEFYLQNEKRRTMTQEPKDVPRKTLINSLDRLRQEMRNMIEDNRNGLIELIEEARLVKSGKKGEIDFKEKIKSFTDDQSFLQFSHINFKIDFMLEKSDLESNINRAIDEAMDAKLKIAEMTYERDNAHLIFKKLKRLIREHKIIIEENIRKEILEF